MAAADELQNTPAISRSSYIHPAIIDLAKEGTAHDSLRKAIATPPTTRGLLADERRLVRFLELVE